MGTVPPSSTRTPSSPGEGAEGLVDPHFERAGRAIALSGVDSVERVLPVSDEEWAARQVWLTQRLDEIDSEDVTSDHVYAQLRRNVDDERRRVGRPPAFEGTY